MKLCVLTFNLFRMGRAALFLNRYQRTARTSDLREGAHGAFVVTHYNLETYGRNSFLRVSTKLFEFFSTPSEFG